MRRLVVGVTIVVLAIAGCSKDDDSVPGAAETPTVQVMDEANAAALEAGLVSDQPAEVEAVLAPAVAEKYAAAPVLLWPEGSNITIDTTQMTVYPSGMATVPATVEGPLAGRWIFVMIQTHGEWRVVATTAVA